MAKAVSKIMLFSLVFGIIIISGCIGSVGNALDVGPAPGEPIPGWDARNPDIGPLDVSPGGGDPVDGGQIPTQKPPGYPNCNDSDYYTGGPENCIGESFCINYFEPGTVTVKVDDFQSFEVKDECLDYEISEGGGPVLSEVYCVDYEPEYLKVNIQCRDQNPLYECLEDEQKRGYCGYAGEECINVDEDAPEGETFVGSKAFNKESEVIDVCDVSNSNILEGYCTTGEEPALRELQCENGCETIEGKGKCIEPISCIDNDVEGGPDYEEGKNPMYIASKAYRGSVVVNDYCVNPGSGDTRLKEAYCSTADSDPVSKTKNCYLGCEEIEVGGELLGKCIEPEESIGECACGDLADGWDISYFDIPPWSSSPRDDLVLHKYGAIVQSDYETYGIYDNDITKPIMDNYDFLILMHPYLDLDMDGEIEFSKDIWSLDDGQWKRSTRVDGADEACITKQGNAYNDEDAQGNAGRARAKIEGNICKNSDVFSDRTLRYGWRCSGTGCGGDIDPFAPRTITHNGTGISHTSRCLNDEDPSTDLLLTYFMYGSISDFGQSGTSPGSRVVDCTKLSITTRFPTVGIKDGLTPGPTYDPFNGDCGPAGCVCDDDPMYGGARCVPATFGGGGSVGEGGTA